MHDYMLATLGGAILGLAAVLLMASKGQILGVSGIINRLLDVKAEGRTWRLSLVLGMISAPLLMSLVSDFTLSIEVSNNTPLLLLAGLLVGMGTTLGNGCTSGHGVCGLSRLSLRSFVAVVVFMLAGFVTVFLMRHVWGG